MVILIFIFLTPKSWFLSGERDQKTVHQSRVVTTVVINPEAIENERDKGRIAERVKALTGRENVEVLEVRKLQHPDGSTRSFEVDIR